MRTFLILLFLFPLVLTCQWKTSSGSNRFDGNFKAASVKGTGGAFPYENPKLVLNRFESGEPNFYLTGIGYTGCSLNRFKIAFDDDKKIYDINHTSTDADREAVFINFDYKFINDLTLYKFIDLLKTKSKLYVRHINGCGDNDYTFSLAGSTRAIENVIEKNYFDEMLENELRKKQEKERRAIILEEIRAEKQKEEIEKERIENERLKREIEEFPSILIESFKKKKKEKLIELFEFNLDSTIYANICFKISPRGRVYPKNLKTAFFASDRYFVCNIIDENCILIHAKSRRSDEVVTRYYIDIKELRKLSDDGRMIILEEHWPNLIKLSAED